MITLIEWQLVKDMPEYSVINGGEYSKQDLVICCHTEDEDRFGIVQFTADFIKNGSDIYSE